MNAQNSMVLVPQKQLTALVYKRLLAWGLEIGLVAISAAVPWGLGQYVLTQRTSELSSAEATEALSTSSPETNWLNTQVPLTPVVQYAQQGWARLAQIPPHQLHRTVPRLTNILWTAALVAPVAVAGGQLWQLKRTGSTWPKRWLGIQVFSMTANSLALQQVLGRELIRWGLPALVITSINVVTEFSFGPWTPSVIGLLAFVEGISAIASDRRAWHDRIARTQVAAVPADKYLPIGNIQQADGELNGASLNGAHNTAVQLYGETMDDEWWLTEAEGNLTSLVLAPRSQLVKTQPGGRLVVLSKSSPSRRLWWLFAGGMVIACVTGFGLGRATRSQNYAQVENDIFLEIAQTLTTSGQTEGDHSAAILMLAQVDDPRLSQYLVDLLSQTSQPETLAAIQQALVSQGLDSLPPLLALSRILDNDLQQPIETKTRQVLLDQRYVVQQAIAKLLTVHSDELVGARLDRVNLGQYRDADRAFRLIQPGLAAAGTSWQGANLSYANLASAKFFDVGPDGKANSYDDIISDLSESALVAVSLEQANLQGIQLANANLRRADLRDANLTYGNLEQTHLTNARLMHVNAAHSQWQGSNLVGADLTQALLQGADFSQARLNRVSASHSDWSKATLSQSDWVEANLIGANFSQANLTRANFQGANLDSADFTRADLRKANLQDADLSQATLTGANLTGADLAGAIFNDGRGAGDSFITPKAQLSAANRMRGVNFSRVRNLDSRQLNYICAQGAVHPACQDIPNGAERFPTQ